MHRKCTSSTYLNARQKNNFVFTYVRTATWVFEVTFDEGTKTIIYE